MIPQGFKPNLAATLTKPELIRYPVWASPKIDGVRCIFFGGVAYSRTLKPFPNPYVQEFARAFKTELDKIDGELVVGSPTDPNCMQASMKVMSKSEKVDFTFYAFDIVSETREFDRRQTELEARMRVFYSRYADAPIRMVMQSSMLDAGALAIYEAQQLEHGYEGVMVRRGEALYKHGRSTEREGGLVKLKRFEDAEAAVMGFEEEVDKHGKPKGTLGALVAVNTHGTAFNIGTGFTAAQRRDFWKNRQSLYGKLVTYKFFNHGVVEAPRHPVFRCFRTELES